MFKVKALYEYSSEHDDDLQFPVGQIITVTEEEDSEWFTGEYTDDAGVHHAGLFPQNFVERYEPVAPPRPTRTRPKKEASPPAPSSPPIPAAAVEEPEAPPSPPTASAPPVSAPVPPSPKKAAPVVEDEPEGRSQPEKTERAATPPPLPAPPALSSPVAVAKHAPPPAASKPAPPVTDKPTGNAFRDRIAAFNKAAAPPITPFKPAGLGGGAGSSNFIKKPFVAPPPSRNAYIPPPQKAPTAKIYRRDEDPEIREREAENVESAERAGLIPAASSSAAAVGPGTGAGGDDDDEPKPMMSLKERLARLQREQQEQAQRHAEAALKKEKPKRPPKKRIDSADASAPTPVAEEPIEPLQRRDTGETISRRSVDEAHPPRAPHVPRRKPSRDTEAQDGNDADMSGAGDTTEGQDDDLAERDDSDEKPKRASRLVFPIIAPGPGPAAEKHPEEAVEEEEEDAAKDKDVTKDTSPEAEEEEAEGEEDEDVDPEARRREELRARMAKMSGGMGMMGMQGMQGMFGGPPPAMKKKKAPAAPERRSSEATEDTASRGPAPPVPTMMALPGLAAVRRSEDKPTSPVDVEETAEPTDETERETDDPYTAEPRSPMQAAPPPPPSARPVPPAPPAPPLSADVKSPSEGSASDDEYSEQTTDISPTTPRPVAPPISSAPPPPAVPTSPASSSASKRNSRPPPPIPALAPALPLAAARPPPPPPPPPGSLSRQSTMEARAPLSPAAHGADTAASSDGEGEEEVTEYEGDYDTDIANPVPHKNSLKAHARESSLDDSISPKSPVLEKAPPFPPPIPGAPRGPPPIPSQPPPPPSQLRQIPQASPSSIADSRRSVDVPRGPPPPPPPPPAKEASTPRYDGEDYDPYSYAAPPTASPTRPMSGFAPHPSQPLLGGDSYTPPDLSLSFGSPSASRAHPPGPPPPPPSAQSPVALHSNRPTARQSLDMSRAMGGSRRSVDMIRPSMESGFVANDIDLAPLSGWWLQPNSLPPQLQGRKDIFFESEEAQSVQEGGKMIVSRDVYILYVDYSQSVISVRFDPSDSANVHLEQRHEAPPRSLRQDQLEQSYERFGRHIADAVLAKKDTVVGDGSPQGLVMELIRPYRDALLPVGTRAYGALVYSNLANASTTQNDEIRAGDIITLRNARFQGKHGAMHAKYSMEVGKPDHVAIVSEWDGTKKKVRAWEQGRENRKVKLESYKLDDLRSGEVKIWRVMPRSWVGWEGQN